MLRRLLMILAGILTLIGAGALSYTYLEQTMGPREAVQETPILSVVKKEVSKLLTTTPVVQKKAVSKPVASTTVAPKKAVTPTLAPVKANDTLAPVAPAVEKTVVAPGPLIATTVTPPANPSDLTVRGVIEYTNGARSLNGGFSALIENEILDRDAQMKLADMFAKQYFEHMSPAPYNVGPAELAQAVGYAYVVVGENLALGDFGSDAKLVDAWMNSPGHRANILKPQYQEIGVAVGKGMYQGRVTWLAVQSFGMPLSACPAIDANLKVQIDTNNVTIAGLRAQLDAKKAQIDATSQNDPNYNVYVNEFNAIVPQYNSLIEANRINVATFNAGVVAFNDCIGSVSTTTH